MESNWRKGFESITWHQLIESKLLLVNWNALLCARGPIPNHQTVVFRLFNDIQPSSLERLCISENLGTELVGSLKSLSVAAAAAAGGGG